MSGYNLPDDIGECFCGRPIRAGEEFCDQCGDEPMVVVETRAGTILHAGVTLAELWAVIEEWVNEAGCVCDDPVYTTARLDPLRQRVRALLGMEPES